MVPDTPDVEAVLFGAGRRRGGAVEGKLVIDMSSISPTATKDFAAKVNAWAATTSMPRSRAARSAPGRRR